MNLRHCFLFISSLPVSGAGDKLRSRANARRRSGRRQERSRPRHGIRDHPINVGDSVVRDETLRTGADSAARLVMADSTNLSLGPNSTLKLDRTVFDDAHSYRDISIKLTTGAFRFVTGHSEKSAYKIQTQVATIGVRGTVLDILSQRGKTTVVLREMAPRGSAP